MRPALAALSTVVCAALVPGCDNPSAFSETITSPLPNGYTYVMHERGDRSGSKIEYDILSPANVTVLPLTISRPMSIPDVQSSGSYVWGQIIATGVQPLGPSCFLIDTVDGTFLTSLTARKRDALLEQVLASNRMTWGPNGANDLSRPEQRLSDVLKSQGD